MILLLSASLHPNSRSRILATECENLLIEKGRAATVFDLSMTPLPLCDGATAYGHEDVQRLAGLVAEADAILVASPIYNYDVNAAAKNAIELTGKNWTGKIVGLMLAAGGQGSFMAPMGLANSLMLDFRCLIVPRFVYATGDAFENDQISDEIVQMRVAQLVEDTLRLADALSDAA
jgi:NAD(P)H-dependent FMN reductase